MNPLGLVPPASAVTAATANPPASLQLHVDRILAAGRRLWLRGRLLGLPEVPAPLPWHWWRRHKVRKKPTSFPMVHLETQVSGHVLHADLTPAPDGVVEAVFTVDLPPARRGWRIARNKVSVQGQVTEACAVVAEPPDDAVGAVVVLLPRGVTQTPDGLSRLAPSPATARLGEQLRRLCQGSHGGHVPYYVACVPSNADASPAALALAVNALGWPSGTFLLVAADDAATDAALTATLDRLRWLLAGRLPIRMFNLDPAAHALELHPAEDRADVTESLHTCADGTGDGNGSDESPRSHGPMILRPSRTALVPRFPLVFCHGMLACTMLRMQLTDSFNYFTALDGFFRQRGFRALFPQVTPTGGVAARAEQLRQQIRDWTDEPVNLVAHSMGGLDARFLITHLGMAGQVRSLTTISTPHHGTYVADWFQANYRRRVPLLVALEAFGINVDGFHDCQVEVCRAFNARTPDAPGVPYFSYNAEVSQARVTPILRRAWSLLHQVEGPNDGLVSVRSACWGELLGTIHADHFAQTPDGLFVRSGETFDSLGFFVRLVEDLARRGF